MRTQRIARVDVLTASLTNFFKSRSWQNSGVGARYLWLVAALLLGVSPAWSQTVRFRTPQIRVTVPLNYNGTTIITNLATISGVGAPVNFTVTGLPAGATYILTDQDTNTLTSSSVTTNLWIWLTTVNVAQGIYTFGLNGSGGAANSLPLVLEAGHMWNGSTNAAVDGAGNWSDSSKWLGGVPGVADDVIFSDQGGQSNSIVSFSTNVVGVVTNVTPNFLVNSIVNNDTTIGSLRFSQLTNSFHTILINPTRKLAITGTNGFSFLRDPLTDNSAGSGFPQYSSMTVTVLGTNASLSVSNPAANFSMLISGQATSLLDMQRLDNFDATVTRFALGDYRLFPNYFTYNYDNQYPNAAPKRFLPNVNFARTNVIRASYRDVDNYTNADSRQYAFSFLNSERQGTTQQPLLLFGISNTFFCDAVNFVGGNQQGNARFNSAFATNFNCVAYFRNTNGGRMSVFSVSDGGGTNSANGGIKAAIDFSGGTLDLQADRFYVGRDRKTISTDANYQGNFTMGAGIVDVNTAVLGYQEYTGQTNTTAFNGYCEGRITVSNTGIFRVNGSLTLGYSTQTDPNGLGSAGNTIWGKIDLVNGGTLMANDIPVGLPAYTSRNNTILVTNNSKLVISNTIASPAQGLDALSVYDSSLTMHINATNVGPYIYTTNLTASGVNIINLGALPVFPNYPTQITLISFQTGGGNFVLGNYPTNQPATPTLFNDETNVVLYIDVLFPQDLVWKGHVNGAWDLTTKNWSTTNGLQTNFHNGDFLIFDNTAISTATINVATNVQPGQSASKPGMTVDSSTLNYRFNSGGGTIQGSKLLKKNTRTLTLNAPMSTSVQVQAGTVNGNGSMGSATVEAGGILNFTGTIVGNIATAGSATSAGVLSPGPVTVQGGGTFTNLGTVGGPFNLSSGAQVFNGGTWTNIGSSTIVSNAIVINAGTMSGDNLSVLGTLKDLAVGPITLTTTLTVGNRGLFIPGGDGINTTTVNGSGNGAFPGRVLFSPGSTNVFKVDPGTPANTLLLSGSQDFGNSQNTPQVNGGVLLITNISATPFAAGQTFKLFGNYVTAGNIFSTGAATNAYPFIVPKAPGPGLAWDLSALRPQGTIGIFAVQTNPIPLPMIPTFGNTSFTTNVAGSVTNVTTNYLLVSQFDWPANYIGWRLEEQTRSLSEGITNAVSNVWSTVFASLWANQVIQTNTLYSIGPTSTNYNPGCHFYRLVYP